MALQVPLPYNHTPMATTSPMLIQTTPALVEFLDSIHTAGFVALDTEFIRTRTYYAQPCTLQMAVSSQQVAILDMLAEVDTAPLWDFLAEPGRTKVFHAAQQDLEIIAKVSARPLPVPLFDTQIAAQAFGFGPQIGYDALVRKLCGVQLDKGAQRADWAQRPLPSELMEYASKDVIHLVDIYEKISSRLTQEQRHEWVQDSMDALAQVRTPDPEQAWQRITHKLRHPRELTALCTLARWREMEAQRRDRPRQHVLSDEALVTLARKRPERAALKPIIGRRSTATVEGLLEALQEAQSRPPIALPTPPKAPPAMLLSMLRIVLAAVAQQHHVTATLIADAENLKALALALHSASAPPPPLHEGWRFDLFTRQVLDVCAGKLALQWDGATFVLRPC